MTNNLSVESVWNDLQAIKVKSPLIHNITNYVVMNSTANALLALGASPIMAHAQEELEDLIGISNALVINIGTLSSYWIESMKIAIRLAKVRGIPIVMDPVGVGASRLRTQVAQELLKLGPPTVIRGNGSEILALTSDLVRTKGVDSTAASQSALDAARELVEHFSCTVVISGEIDLIVNKTGILKINNGHPIMTKVTGMGCAATTFVAAFNTINPSPLMASAHSMAVMGIAGEIAESRSSGPGSFPAAFLDSVYNLKKEDIQKHLRMNL
ncbi:MAG: hydroxyethylthiazole kinase [Bdellovibrionales bacterium RIFCSPHIGHO2_01_FULL_40_29]|nr:MAG: hydroxyethylthiazole kinase [Bdellovibrionales bacterium RIFCSPHIGHO2_01_FULL_40_29]OFZ33447.1 MAG: hydroxyethylthiazole kinase [Bdellovibrionales bacterium RIFCSPHIGHO2_02_FULL_40_15]